jgi:hypothetical protein
MGWVGWLDGWMVVWARPAIVLVRAMILEPALSLTTDAMQPMD